MLLIVAIVGGAMAALQQFHAARASEDEETREHEASSDS
jgi:hypothetical protein